MFSRSHSRQQASLEQSPSIDDELLDFELPESLNGYFPSQDEDQFFIDDFEQPRHCPRVNRRNEFMPPPPQSPVRNQAPPPKKIFTSNYTPVYQDLPDVPPQGPADFSTFIKFGSLDEARQLAQNSHSSNDGCYLLIPVKFIARIRNDPRLKPLVGYYLKK